MEYVCKEVQDKGPMSPEYIIEHCNTLAYVTSENVSEGATLLNLNVLARTNLMFDDYRIEEHKKSGSLTVRNLIIKEKEVQTITRPSVVAHSWLLSDGYKVYVAHQISPRPMRKNFIYESPEFVALRAEIYSHPVKIKKWWQFWKS